MIYIIVSPSGSGINVVEEDTDMSKINEVTLNILEAARERDCGVRVGGPLNPGVEALTRRINGTPAGAYRPGERDVVPGGAGSIRTGQVWVISADGRCYPSGQGKEGCHPGGYDGR